MKELTLQEHKDVQLEILQQVHDFCETNNIKYSLAYGTLIGAVRHQGYIPWDDDIDICMLREDYDKFITSFNNSINGFRVRSLETDANYSLPFAKVESLNTRIEEVSNVSMEIGINIDVFPIDGIEDNEKARKIFYKKLKRKQQLLTLKSVKLASSRRFVKNLVLLIGQLFLCLVSLRKLAENIDKFIDKQNHSSLLLCEQELCTYGLKSCFSRTCMTSFVKMKFENREFFVMEGYHEYLSNIYDNYMQLPPADKQVTHHALKSYKIG